MLKAREEMSRGGLTDGCQSVLDGVARLLPAGLTQQTSKHYR